MSNVLLQCLLGMRCNDFSILAADQICTQSIIVVKNDEEKLHQISDRLVMGVNGDPGDIAQFSQFIAKNIQLYKMRNMYQISTEAAVHFTRKNLAESLRTGRPYTVNLLIAGYDDVEGGQLYYMDYLASSLKVPFACHGFGGMLSMSILGQHYSPSLKEQDAYDVLKKCVQEVNKRLFVNLPHFQVKVINKNGVKVLPTIRPE